jgi:hypothetical protein
VHEHVWGVLSGRGDGKRVARSIRVGGSLPTEHCVHTRKTSHVAGATGHAPDASAMLSMEALKMTSDGEMLFERHI